MFLVCGSARPRIESPCVCFTGQYLNTLPRGCSLRFGIITIVLDRDSLYSAGFRPHLAHAQHCG
jgi:hypothetical protein